MQNATLFHRLSFSPWLIHEKQQSWRFVSYGLIHAGWMHLAVNMFVLYSFGRHVEESFQLIFGSTKGLLFYALLYIGGILFSTLYDYAKHKSDIYYNAVGASGAVAAVLFSSIIITPTSSLFVFPIPFPVPAYIFGVLYLLYSMYMGKKGQDNIGHNAHFYGAVFGLVFTLIAEPDLANMFWLQLTNP
jgi:membrane associated rhomboid family serine protease